VSVAFSAEKSEVDAVVVNVLPNVAPVAERLVVEALVSVAFPMNPLV
jgi:hypothetical protein